MAILSFVYFTVIKKKNVTHKTESQRNRHTGRRLCDGRDSADTLAAKEATVSWGRAWDGASHPDPKRARPVTGSQTPRTVPSAASPSSHP